MPLVPASEWLVGFVKVVRASEGKNACTSASLAVRPSRVTYCSLRSDGGGEGVERERKESKTEGRRM